MNTHQPIVEEVDLNIEFERPLDDQDYLAPVEMKVLWLGTSILIYMTLTCFFFFFFSFSFFLFGDCLGTLSAEFGL